MEEDNSDKQEFIRMCKILDATNELTQYVDEIFNLEGSRAEVVQKTLKLAAKLALQESEYYKEKLAEHDKNSVMYIVTEFNMNNMITFASRLGKFGDIIRHNKDTKL